MICKRKYYHFAGGEVLIAQKTGAPGAIPTRDLPLRSRIHEPFVFNSYEKSLTNMRVHTLHIVLDVPSL